MLRTMHAMKDAAYKERNLVVSALSKVWPAHLSIDATQPKRFQYVVCIHSPAGQLTWHFPSGSLHLFIHLETKPSDWDGHSTEEKYKRLAALQSV